MGARGKRAWSVGATLGGIDSLLSTVQMPPGVPVATVGIGPAGAKNAAWLAAQILATKNLNLHIKILEERYNMKTKILEEQL